MQWRLLLQGWLEREAGVDCWRGLVRFLAVKCVYTFCCGIQSCLALVEAFNWLCVERHGQTA